MSTRAGSDGSPVPGRTLIVKHPGFTATAVLSRALGIGVYVVACSYLNHFMYRPLPAREPHRLVAVLTRFENSDRNNHSSYLDYRDLRDRTTAFDGVLAHFFFPVGVKTGDRPMWVAGASSSACASRSAPGLTRSSDW